MNNAITIKSDMVYMRVTTCTYEPYSALVKFVSHIE